MVCLEPLVSNIELTIFSHRPAGPNEVILTGDFDNWSGSLPLVKTSSGEFEIALPVKVEDSNKFIFKFIVDGDWKTSTEYQVLDEDGNQNNYLDLKAVETSGSSEDKKQSKIPEAGGLAVSSKSANTTVMPSEEGKQTTLGEPGIAIPANAADIKEFSQVSNVSAKELNEKMNKADNEENVKTTVMPSTEGQQVSLAGEPGVVIPTDTEAFEKVSDVDAKKLNEKLNGEDKKVKVKKVIKRNKKTGEETVVSVTPVDEAATTTTSAPQAQPEAQPETKPKAKAEESKPVAPATQKKAESKTKTSAKPEKKDKKEKKSFFKKLFS